MMGVREQDIERALEPYRTAPDFEVYQENWEAFAIFISLRTQWRWLSGLGRPLRIGLNYGALSRILRFWRIPKERHGDIFDAVQVMESAVIEASNED